MFITDSSEQTGILQTSIFNRIFLVTFELRQLQTRTDKDRQTGTLQQKSCWSAGTSPTRMLLVRWDQWDNSGKYRFYSYKAM